jgi:hypothetical protein
MSFINELFDKIGKDRYELVGLPELPEGDWEWLLYREDDCVHVELYGPTVWECLPVTVQSLDPDEVLAVARAVYDERIGDG